MIIGHLLGVARPIGSFTMFGQRVGTYWLPGNMDGRVLSRAENLERARDRYSYVSRPRKHGCD
jgi:hypothetical protein